MDEQEIKTTVERILADLQTCTEAVETMRPIVSDAALLNKFDRTYSAHVVTVLQDILCRYAILTLCRMWDKDKDAQSIPNVATHLGNGDHASIKNEVNNILDNSDELKLMRNWRNKNLGHALVRSSGEKNGVISDPMWGDIFELHCRTRMLVERLALAAGDISIDVAEQKRVFARNAQAYWNSFVDKPK